MEPARIKQLLEKYWQAETTEAEEAELSEYFDRHDGSADDSADALFEYFQHEKSVSLPEAFNDQLKASMVAKKRPVRWIYPLLKVAAILLITFSVIYIFVPGRKTPPVASIEADTYNDPQQAYIETRKALLLISNHLNTGKDYIGEVGKINKAEQLIHSKTN